MLTLGYENFKFTRDTFVQILMHMFRIFEPRSALDKMRAKYTYLMRTAYEVAVLDKSKSDALNEKACKILREIRRMEIQQENQ